MTLLLMSVCLSAHVVMLHLDVTQQHTVKQVLIKLIKTLHIFIIYVQLPITDFSMISQCIRSHLMLLLPPLGRHGSASLCRVERENKMAATYNVLAFKR